MLLIALRHIAEARGGIATVAKAVGVERKTLDRMLSGRGNLPFSTVAAIIKAVGFRITVEVAKSG